VGVIVGFIGENLGKAKGVKILIFSPLSRVCFLLWGFNGYMEWIIQLD
jgi:tetrahydromethanopterin S-methyltransferase subunit C